MLKQLLIVCLFAGTWLACQPSGPKVNLTDEDKTHLLNEIDRILEADQQYRGAISLGTLNDSILAEDAEKSKTLTIEEYMAYRRTLQLELPKSVEDSLWLLQHQLDSENHQAFVKIIQGYGYPSPERLGVEDDRLFVVLLHPPADQDIPQYLANMQALLLPEVKSGRMPGRMYATFYDNIKAKILNEPQLYGTNKSFDQATMSMGPPDIEDIEVTNAARAEIGLPPLQEGEYK
ncbi:MAG: hypothetical protein KDC44_06890 [Phaeodactylibacter sp.]|nr:hypothetical protein [Phaeodactylibacter sp.]